MRPKTKNSPIFSAFPFWRCLTRQWLTLALSGKWDIVLLCQNRLYTQLHTRLLKKSRSGLSSAYPGRDWRFSIHTLLAVIPGWTPVGKVCLICARVSKTRSIDVHIHNRPRELLSSLWADIVGCESKVDISGKTFCEAAPQTGRK